MVSNLQGSTVTCCYNRWILFVHLCPFHLLLCANRGRWFFFSMKAMTPGDTTLSQSGTDCLFLAVKASYVRPVSVCNKSKVQFQIKFVIGFTLLFLSSLQNSPLEIRITEAMMPQDTKLKGFHILDCKVGGSRSEPG